MGEQTSWADGTTRQKVLFAILVGIYVLGLLIAFADKMDHVGRPNVGWTLDGAYVFPTRRDALPADLGGGGRAIRINDFECKGDWRPTDVEPGVHKQLGETNTLVLEGPRRKAEKVVVRVRILEWKDTTFTEGATFALGALFFIVGVTSFILRPYAPGSWALLALCAVAGGALTNVVSSADRTHLLHGLYFRTLIGFLVFIPFHTGLAFPIVHRILARRPRPLLLLIYGLGAIHALCQFAGWYTEGAWPFRYLGALETGTLLASMLFFVGRCFLLAVSTRDPLVGQRARILLAGTLFGAAPFAFINFMRNTFSILVVDMRLAFLTLGIFLLAIGYITVRHDLLNARIAAQRAIIYAATVSVLTAIAVVLVAVHSYALTVLLLPLLYWWPLFDARLDAWLYPKRARFPDLVREMGNEIGTRTSVDAVLGVLARAPAQLCDARSSAAFLLPGAPESDGHFVACGDSTVTNAAALVDEPLVQLMRTTRKEMSRNRISLNPQYSNIKADCARCFARLDAEVLLPLLQDSRVAGGLALGPRATGDVYEAAELQALTALAQQAMQAIIRVNATERLRARELEFADLKRFFPPQVINQVMAKGGAAELRSQRKLVTVFFADLRGFTSFSDSVEPEEVMATLAEYHGAMGRRIAEFAGTLERFAGDGVMVFFNDPVEQPDHPRRAVRMALAMRGDVRCLSESWSRKGYAIGVGMGIHTGYATCGFIGYEGRRDYGVIGNVTNLAARLSDAAKPAEILITERVRAELPEGCRTESAGELALKGFHQPQTAYRVLGESNGDSG